MQKQWGKGALRLPLFFLIIYILVSGTILSFSAGGFLLDFKRIGFSVVSSLQEGVHTVSSGISNFFQSVAKLSQLKKDYEELSRKLENYEFMQRNNAEIKKENARLKELLGFSDEIEYKNIPATIIGRDPNASFSGITINKGSLNNIRKGMPVVAIQSGNVGLVGKVVSVGFSTSLVMPVFDYQCNVSGRIEKTRDIGIVTGTGDDNGVLTMSYIKKRVLDELSYGDIVVTSGENDNYMRNIPIGTISKIKILDYDTSLEIELNPVIDFSRLENVVVVDKNERKDE